jgi:hypothetical protein
MLGGLVRSVVDSIAVDAATTIVCVVADVSFGRETAADLVVAGTPTELRQSVIVSAAGSDGVAHAFLTTADAVLVRTAADAAIPAVAAVSTSTPVALMGSFGVAASAWNDAVTVRPATRGPIAVLSAEDGLERVAEALADSDSPAAVVHTTDGAEHALRLTGGCSLGLVDVVLLCQVDPVHGMPRPERPVPTVVMISGSAYLPAVRLLRSCGDLSEFVRALLDPANAGRLHLRLLPAPLGSRAIDVGAPPNDVSDWFGEGPIPTATSTSIIRLEQPKPSPTRQGAPSVRGWVKEHRWSDRVRLALPWKGGLLERGMRGRW